MIPPTFVHDLLSRVDVVEVVGRHVELKRAGVNHKGLCPFHGEKTPSFIVSPSRQTYHCFGCGAHGNAVGFLMEHGGLGFIDAVRDLAQQVGMTVPEDDSTPAERERAAKQKQRQATLSEVLAKAGEHYRQTLKNNPRAIDYLKGRGLSGKIAARFGLGYAPPGWRGLASAFAHYDDPLLEESGMVIQQALSGDGTGDAKRYDRFRDRIMFPIRSVQGDVIGFGGRVLDQGEPKYLNSPETPIFNKGRELYGLHEARIALRQRGYALVVEGYMDVVALAQAGFSNAVATLGTACTAEHVQKLFRFTDSVVFSFDGDAAGRRAAARALEASLPHASDTRTIRFLFLPHEHDPDSFVRQQGAEAFERCIAQALPLSRQLVETAAEGCDLDTAEGRARLLAQARPLIEQLPVGMLRRQIVDVLAETARIAPTELAGWHDARPARPRSAATGAADPAPARAARDWSEGRRQPRLRPRAAMASSLDRAVWLLINRSELWANLDHEAHELLTEQPGPHGEFFAWLDRLIHENGPVAASALVDSARADPASETLRALTERIIGLLPFQSEDHLMGDIRIILDRLRLDAIEVELSLYFESEGLSGDSRKRVEELVRLRADFKHRLFAAPATPRE